MSAFFTVIGFSGRPVQAATGWKPPIVYDARADRAYLEAHPSETWTMEEVRRFEDERHVSLLPSPRPHRQGSTLVYAHELFMKPNGKCAPVFTNGALDLDYVPALESYVTLASEEDAIEMYRKWSEHLFEFGRSALLSAHEAELAFAAAMRARYCSIPKVLHVLRLQIFELAFAALAVLGRPVGPLIEDARADFNEDELTAIEEGGTALAAESGERESVFLTRDCDLSAARRGFLRAEAHAP